MISDWAAVGFGFSTGSSPILLGLPEGDAGEVDELLLLLSLLLKLHAIRASTNTNIHGRCFIAIPDLSLFGIKSGSRLLLECLATVNRNAITEQQFRNCGVACYPSNVPLSLNKSNVS